MGRPRLGESYEEMVCDTVCTACGLGYETGRGENGDFQRDEDGNWYHWCGQWHRCRPLREDEDGEGFNRPVKFL